MKQEKGVRYGFQLKVRARVRDGDGLQVRAEVSETEAGARLQDTGLWVVVSWRV